MKKDLPTLHDFLNQNACTTPSKEETIEKLIEEIELLIDRAEEGRIGYSELEHARKLVFTIRAKEFTRTDYKTVILTKPINEMSDLAKKLLGIKNVEDRGKANTLPPIEEIGYGVSPTILTGDEREFTAKIKNVDEL